MATTTVIATSGTTTFTGVISSANSRSSPPSLTSTSTAYSDVLASSTTLQPNATNIPAPLRFCSGNSILTFQNAFPACGVVASNASTGVMSRCCRSAPVVLYGGGCNLWCESRNQTLEQLNSCISDNLRSSNASGPILCNRSGPSYTQLFPENTADPATRTTPTRTPTGSASPSASSGAASHVRSLPTEESVSFGAIAAFALLALGGFSSLLV